MVNDKAKIITYIYCTNANNKLMINKTYFLCLANFFLIIACTNSDQKDNKTSSINEATEQNLVSIDSNVIKVFVDKTGQITANGIPTYLNVLDSCFSKLKISNGVVYYSRDNVEADPPEESMKVMELITKYSLPVKFYTDKTFTQAVKLN